MYICVCSVQSETLVGKKVVMFSYGSGLASAMYSLRVTSDLSALNRLVSTVTDVPKRLSDRVVVEPEQFAATMKLREETHHLAPYTPTGDITKLYPGTFYLASIDDKHRRVYERVAPSNKEVVKSVLKSPLAQISELCNESD